MIKATLEYKSLVLDILTASFMDNKSVNYIIPQGDQKHKRIRSLMDYSFEVCSLFGKVLLSDDRKACALLVYPDQKRTTLKSIWLDTKLLFTCIGIANLFKTIGRESKISKIQPKERMCYLWFIGVNPIDQGLGIGSKLLKELIMECEKEERPIFLETSTMKNLPWYKKFGFETYAELKLTYTLYFMKRNLDT
ncbi:GNAT family N-acetyltransferase [Daejeonella sp. JGW-45]|uniref:GNAT family N-acetyltransferase n=1 Tax=Daejeonella sp. JGW-45 TaxID=3034148 RepID=UPI0023ECA0EA|nr:GNAT family N-acetyltransferase [Daejeonella sp. JGW-45]